MPSSFSSINIQTIAVVYKAVAERMTLSHWLYFFIWHLLSNQWNLVSSSTAQGISSLFLNLVDSSHNIFDQCSVWYWGQFSSYFAFLKHLDFHDTTFFRCFLTFLVIPEWAIFMSWLLNIEVPENQCPILGKTLHFSPYDISVTLIAWPVYSGQIFPWAPFLSINPNHLLSIFT